MRRFPLALAFMVVPSLALLAGEGEGGGWMAPLWHVPTIFWQIFNAGLVAGLFFFLLRKRAPEFLSGRAGEIRRSLERAIREKEEALDRLADIEAKMARLEDEVAAIAREAEASAMAERERVLKETEATRERLREEASAEMDRRLLAARRELGEYAASLVRDMAREEIARTITAQDEERLMEEFLTKLEAGAHGRCG